MSYLTVDFKQLKAFVDRMKNLGLVRSMVNAKQDASRHYVKEEKNFM
jgi:hypothetical protein